jgi:type I restriction enzyme, S subunit
MIGDLRTAWESAGGVLPDPCDVVALETLLLSPSSIGVGVMYPGDHAPDGVPLLKVGDIKGGQVISEPTFRISADTNHTYQRTQLLGDELLITLVGNPGECVLATPAMAGWNPARAIAVLRLRDPLLRPYIKAVLQTRPGRHLIDAVLNTTVQKTLNLKDIRRFPIPMPSPVTVSDISSFADSISSRIELLRETNATLEGIAQALFKSWFVDFDPVRAKSEGRSPEGMDAATAALFPDTFQDSPLGPIPSGWETAALDAVADFRNGLAMQKFPSSGTDDVLPVIKIAQLRKGSAEGADQATRAIPSDYLVQDGDVLFSWSGTLEVEIWCGGDGALNQHLFKVTSQRFDKWFYYLWTRHHLDDFRLVAAGKATTMGHIQRSHLAAAIVVVPDSAVHEAADRLLSPLFERVITNALQARYLVALRDELLPRLISGRLRLQSTGTGLGEGSD